MNLIKGLPVISGITELKFPEALKVKSRNPTEDDNMLRLSRGVLFIFILILVLPVLAREKARAGPLEWSGRVIEVVDGDSILVRSKNGRVEVRLAEVDAPELGQSFGRQAKEFLAGLALGKTVRVCPIALAGPGDDYHGIVAHVFLKDGRSLSCQVDDPRGDPRDPLDAAALADKVRQFAGDRDNRKLGEVIGGILELEKVSDVTGLLAKI